MGTEIGEGRDRGIGVWRMRQRSYSSYSDWLHCSLLHRPMLFSSWPPNGAERNAQVTHCYPARRRNEVGKWDSRQRTQTRASRNNISCTHQSLPHQFHSKLVDRQHNFRKEKDSNKTLKKRKKNADSKGARSRKWCAKKERVAKERQRLRQTKPCGDIIFFFSFNRCLTGNSRLSFALFHCANVSTRFYIQSTTAATSPWFDGPTVLFVTSL